MVPSNIAIENGITIYDAQVSDLTLRLVIVIVAIFYPTIFTYQTWKYMKFAKKVKLNDE